MNAAAVFLREVATNPKKLWDSADARKVLARLDDPAELSLMRKLALYPRLVEAAALAHEPHRVAFYLYELASEFHAQWTRGNDAPRTWTID